MVELPRTLNIGWHPGWFHPQKARFCPTGEKIRRVDSQKAERKHRVDPGNWLRRWFRVPPKPQGKRGAFTTVYTQWLGERGGVWPELLWVFPDESIWIQTQSLQTLRSVEDLKPFVLEGVVSLAPPSNSYLIASGRFTTILNEVRSEITAEDLLLDIEDVAAQLRGEPDRVALCRRAVTEYADNPSPQNREALESAYNQVPGHMRRFILGMDLKNHPLRRMFSGETGETEALEELRASDLWGMDFRD